MTQEEISLLLQEGTKAGVFEEGEHEMIKRVFRFCDRRARALMTPRSDVVWLDIADSPDEIRAKIVSSHHTRFPVCDQSLDNLLGIVQIKDLLVEDTSLEPFRIKGRLTVPLFIYEGTRGLKTLESFKKSSSRVAVVLDEFGTVLGLVTLSDILQAIVGDMPRSIREVRTIRRPCSGRMGRGFSTGGWPWMNFATSLGFQAYPRATFTRWPAWSSPSSAISRGWPRASIASD